MKTLSFLLPILLAVSTSVNTTYRKSYYKYYYYPCKWSRRLCIGVFHQPFPEVHKHWSYRNSPTTYGPEEWFHYDQECGMLRQSPVLLQCSKRQNVGPISFRMTGGATEARATNNGHSLVFSISTSNERPLRMSGGPLSGDFVVEQFHFHWGSEGSAVQGEGSEHRISRRSSVAELHIVTYNGKYPTFKEAVTKSDGLAVFGVLFGKQPMRNNPVYTGDVNLQQLIKKGSSVVIPRSKNLAGGLFEALRKTKFTQHYYTYPGSLTTPPCTQNVRWIVSRRFAGLPYGMLSALQQLRDESNNLVVDNFRPLQDLNGREIVCS